MKRVKYNSIIGISLIISAVFCSSNVYAKNANYITKAVSQDTEKIQQLIDAADEGEECGIPEGVYTISELNITHPIVLNGNSKVTLKYLNNENSINRQDQSFIFAIWSSGVVIDGFRFESKSAANTCIAHYYGDNLEIRNNIFCVGQDSIGINSQAAANNYIIDSNIFIAEPGLRSSPIIQFGEKSSGVKIKNNTLEGCYPDILTSDFLSNFLTVKSNHALIADNEFLYTGPLNNEDLGGYEDSETPVTLEAFAELTRNHINDINPWKRSTTDKINPETSDNFGIAALVIAAAMQIAVTLVYIHFRKRA